RRGEGGVISAMRLWAMARKEMIQLRRDTRSMVLAFVLPLFLVLVFGAAISLDVTHIPFVVLDRDRSGSSRELVEAFEASGYFENRGTIDRPSEADRLLRQSRVRMVLVIPPDYGRELAARRRATVQALVDGSDANTATIALNYAEAIVARLGAAAALDGRRVTPRLTAEVRVWYNEALESARTVVPGLVAVIMAMVAAMLTALTIAREWERGTMEQLAATPVGRLEVILGKLAPYIAIGVVDVAMVAAVGWLVFDVPIRGNLVLLGILSLLFMVGVLGFGMFLSAALKSQMLASQVALMGTYLPTFLLSGFLFPIANMPLVLQGISWLVPARYFVVITRGVFLKGVGFIVLWPQVLGLALYATAALLLATLAFRKEIE
ncbi:MAG TPA: ABC transporter permease, partial [Gemmatimonadales bacterium]|nr:ABC transporter permease [Gemmatimonadales bacterium]